MLKKRGHVWKVMHITMDTLEDTLNEMSKKWIVFSIQPDRPTSRVYTVIFYC